MPDTNAPFQLNPDDFRTGNLIFDPVIKKLVKAINGADLNKNLVPDIAEAAAISSKLMPLLAALDKAIDFDMAGKLLAEAPFVKDKALLADSIKQLGTLAESAAKLIPEAPEAPEAKPKKAK